MEIKDRDSSTIIREGSLEKTGYLTRITREVFSEIKSRVNTSTSNWIFDDPTPDWSSFKFCGSNKVCSIYTFSTSTANFFIEKILPGKSSRATLCGSPNHLASLIITNITTEASYPLCRQIAEHAGDFSQAKQYIFSPTNHDSSTLDAPCDKCLGRTLKKITLVHYGKNI